ncbi:hypothetical protein WDW86_21275 [Bdellovibrionota bacterium FG-2]
MRKTGFIFGMLLVVASFATFASTVATLEGKVYSMTSEIVVLQSDNTLYYIKRASLNQLDQKRIKKMGNQVALNVPMEAIQDIKQVKASKK